MRLQKKKSNLLPWGSDGKDSACNAGDPGSVRSPGEGNDNPLQYSCLGNPMDKGAWQATVHGVTKRRTQLSNHTHRQKKSKETFQKGGNI